MSEELKKTDIKKIVRPNQSYSEYVNIAAELKTDDIRQCIVC